MDPRIAVVMITRNRREETLASLRRLRALPEAPRLLVIDNGSTDGTAAAIARWDPAVEVVSLETNLGAAARNIGVLRAGTPYVAFSDDDSWWAPGALGRAADLFDRHPRLGLVNGRILVGPEERLDPVCSAMNESALGLAAKGPGVPIVGFVACGAIVRTQAFLEAGGFERRFGVGGEEAMLALDLLSSGWALRYVDDIVAYHHPSPARDPRARQRHERRNALWVTWLRRPGRVALEATARALREAVRNVAAREAFVEALTGMPWVLRCRRAVPAEVERMVRRAG